MVNVVVVGTIGLDAVETPFGKVQDVLGGSASYASYAASFFAKTGLVSIIGKDFPQTYKDILEKKGIDFQGVVFDEKDGKTFRWEGVYEYDMNEAKTKKTELNALQHFKAELPPSYKKAKFVFVGNNDPDLQLKVIEQLENPELIVMDTMNLWITIKKQKVLEAISKVDMLVFNDGEARQLFETVNLLQAANKALALGPRAVIIKKGEHGALLFTKDSHFSAPGYPLEVIKDPTGCGDTFGGGLIGYLAKTGKLDQTTMRKAVIYGSVFASFNAEDFSLNRMQKLSWEEIEQRFNEFKAMREF